MSQLLMEQSAQQTLQSRLDRALSRSRSLKMCESVDPLDLLQANELDAISAKDKSVSTHLDDKKYLESRLPVIQFEELKLISIKIAPSSAYNSVVPSALACSMELVLVGYTNGLITVFNSTGNEKLVLKPTQDNLK